MRSLFLGMSVAACAAMPLITCAEQKTVSPGETVTVAGSDISSWAAADIDIGAGATLLFSEPTESVEFTGKITGSGHFVASSAVTTAKPWEFNMNGDATGFTGGFFYTNVLARIVSPTSVGDSARITIYVEYNTGDGAKSHFFGPTIAGKPDYIYRNPLDVRVGPNNGLVVNDRTVLAGDIIHRYGVIHGPGTITGNITTYATAITFADNLTVEGSCHAANSGAKIDNVNTIYLKGKTYGFSQFSVINCYMPVYLEGDNLFGENVVLQMGENWTGDGKYSGRLELNGHSQIFKRAFFKMDLASPEYEKLKEVGGIGNTGAPATITFADNDDGKWFLGRLDGHLSVRVSGPKMLGFSSVLTNSMDGTITHSGERGGGSIVMGGAWPNLKRIESVNGGLVDIRSSATINPKAVIDIDGSSQIKVATGLTLTVRTLRINGVELPIGTYHKNSSAVVGYFDSLGNGFVKVTGAPGFKVSIK